MLHKIPEEQRSQLYRDGSLKSFKWMCSLCCHYAGLLFCFQILNTVYTLSTILKHIKKSWHIWHTICKSYKCAQHYSQAHAVFPRLSATNN